MLLGGRSRSRPGNPELITDVNRPPLGGVPETLYGKHIVFPNGNHPYILNQTLKLFLPVCRNLSVNHRSNFERPARSKTPEFSCTTRLDFSRLVFFLTVLHMFPLVCMLFVKGQSAVVPAQSRGRGVRPNNTSIFQSCHRVY